MLYDGSSSCKFVISKFQIRGDIIFAQIESSPQIGYSESCCRKAMNLSHMPIVALSNLETHEKWKGKPGHAYSAASHLVWEEEPNPSRKRAL